REAGRALVPLGEQDVEARRRSEAVAQEIGLAGDDRVRLALVGGELADEIQDHGDVGGGGWAEGQHRRAISSAGSARQRGGDDDPAAQRFTTSTAPSFHLAAKGAVGARPGAKVRLGGASTPHRPASLSATTDSSDPLPAPPRYTAVT